MGRNRGHKIKLHEEIEAVREKTLEASLFFLTRKRFGICEPEAKLLVHRSLAYLRAEGRNRQERRANNQIHLQLPQNVGLMWRNGWSQLPSENVILTPIAADDLDVWEYQGVPAMQNARLLRLIEEAERAQATMPMAFLSTLVPLNRRAISNRLQAFWKSGFRLPVLGSKQSAEGGKTRLSETLLQELKQVPVQEVETQLCLSPSRRKILLQDAIALSDSLLKGYDATDAGKKLDMSEAEVRSVDQLLRESLQNSQAKKRLETLIQNYASVSSSVSTPGEAQEPREEFETKLIRNHNFSMAKAMLYVNEIEQEALAQYGENRSSKAIVFYAIAADEPADKQRSACRLQRVVLDYVKDSDHRGPTETTGLKLDKLIRFATGAKSQGGLLTIPDLAFLVGIAPQSVVRILSASKVYVPTRGKEWDIGPGISHKTKILRLYVEGYTETEIVRRTHHTYESVERYVKDFRTVMCLHERGLPQAHVRQVTGKSKRLVQAYLELYEELNVSENQWKLNLMRLAFKAQEKKSPKTTHRRDV